ncbi:hypothetical protein N0V90_013049 [Kalmusia sp. IMI 367209]|nr:hypothetical protein N0V90_013049 [Kalmusia sp. IMI 367209]
MLYNNENQPDKNVRIFQAVGVTLLATIPSAILSFLTAPYVNKITLTPVPPSARHSLTALRSFVRNLPSTTKVTFQTLRIFPIPKHTTAYVHELRALPPRTFRFANIELPKSDAWRKRQVEKGWVQRAWEVVAEPRYKFYVREGRVYTMRSGVPGVWEEVARGITQRTEMEAMSNDGEKTRKQLRATQKTRLGRPIKHVEEVKAPVVKRQTARRL